MYTFIQLDPRRGTDQLTAEQWAETLGIEVTIPALADACGRGNVDPQHGYGRGNLEWQEAPSAIDALSHAPTFGSGVALATVRPDVDSIGAMACCVLHALRVPLTRYPERDEAGGPGQDDMYIAFRARVDAISAADAFTPGASWAPRALPTPESLWPTTAAPVSETRDLAPLHAICSPVRGQTERPLADRVAIVASWLLCGPAAEQSEMASWSEQRDILDQVIVACGSSLRGWHDAMTALGVASHEAHTARMTLALAVHDGRVVPRTDTYQCVCGDQTVAVDGVMTCRSCGPSGLPAIAIVESAHIGALGLGYCLAPIVVAAMPPGEPVAHEHTRVGGSGGMGDQPGHCPGCEIRPRKYTIAAWSPDLVDFAALKAALCAIEPGWGGGASIVGSPQGSGSLLPICDVISAVRSAVRVPA